MFTEKFTFENLRDRTAQVSFLFALIYQINSKIGGKKEGKRPFYRACPLRLRKLASNQKSASICTMQRFENQLKTKMPFTIS